MFGVTCQVSEVTKPLNAASKMCDAGKQRDTRFSRWLCQASVDQHFDTVRS